MQYTPQLHSQNARPVIQSSTEGLTLQPWDIFYLIDAAKVMTDARKGSKGRPAGMVIAEYLKLSDCLQVSSVMIMNNILFIQKA